MFHSITLVTALLLTWISLPAVAQDGLYVELTPGVSILADSDLSGASGAIAAGSATAEFDAAFVIGGALGFRFFDSFRGEMNISYRKADVDSITDFFGTLQGAGDVGLVALMANVYYDLELEFPVTPYLGAGIGIGFIDVDPGNSNVLIVDDSATEFAWNIMVGASYGVTDNIDLSVGYRYLGTTDPELDATLVGTGSGTLDAEIAIHEILFGFRYNFQERAGFKEKRDTSEKTAFPKPIPIQNVEESADEPDLVEKLAELHRLHQAGALTDEEYKRAKARLLE